MHALSSFVQKYKSVKDQGKESNFLAFQRKERKVRKFNRSPGFNNH